MNFYEITCESACLASVPAKTGDDVLHILARQAHSSPAMREYSEADIYKALADREAQGSTGLGGGVAIPHARLDRLENFVFFIVTTRRPVEFAAVDKKKVSVFFALFAPAKQVKEHLRTLAALSNVIARTNVVNELRLAATGPVLYESFLSRTTDEKPARLQEKLKLMVVILYAEEKFYDLLELFLQEGIDGATVIDSVGMGHYISSIPLFSSFVSFMREDRNRSRTLLVPVPEDQVQRVAQGIEEITGDLDKTLGAMIMVLDIPFSRGTMKML